VTTKNKRYCSRECYNTKRPNMVKNAFVKKCCKTCNNTFETNRISSKYCSEACYQLERKKTNIELKCKNCGNYFFVRKSRYELGIVKYCSIVCRNTSPDWIDSNIIKNVNQLHKVGLNKLELLGRQILIEMGLDFLEQELVCKKYVVDVLIPEKNLVIQWDGNYWHGHPNNLKNGKPNKLQEKNIEKDKRVTNDLTKNGYIVLRFWQSDVEKNKDFVKSEILNALK
jgi:very-short-patch-repair endonuclease